VVGEAQEGERRNAEEFPISFGLAGGRVPDRSGDRSAGRAFDRQGQGGGRRRRHLFAASIYSAKFFERVRADYVEKPDDTNLIEGAINGMVTSLDPHSRYMNDKACAKCRRPPPRIGRARHRGHNGGRLVTVVAPIDDTPAAKAGIMSGDLITQIDEDAVQGLSLEQAVNKMKARQHQDQTQDPAQGQGRAARRHAQSRDHPGGVRCASTPKAAISAMSA